MLVRREKMSEEKVDITLQRYMEIIQNTWMNGFEVARKEIIRIIIDYKNRIGYDHCTLSHLLDAVERMKPEEIEEEIIHANP